MSVELKASVVEDDMCVMPLKDEEFCWQIPHENYPLALELTEYITATDKYFISELDPFNPGESLVRDVMHLFDSGKVIPREFVAQLLKKSIAQHGKIPNVVPVSRSRFESESNFSTELPYSGSVTVVGDLHGQYGDFANLFTNPAFGGLPSTYNRFVINGDMVDRGLYSVEIMVLALLIKLFFPDDMHLLRGNHESAGMNASHGFHDEILSKYPKGSYSLCTLFAQLFNALPVAAVIEGQIFVTHGGLGAQVSKLTIAEINSLNRFQEPWHCAPLTELMWSDPSDALGFTANTRGPNVKSFGPDVTKTFLVRNNLKWMIRSHEHCDNGFHKQHDDLCWTVFSAPNYCDKEGNLGAVIRFQDDLNMEPTLLHMLPVHYPLPPFTFPSFTAVPCFRQPCFAAEEVKEVEQEVEMEKMGREEVKEEEKCVNMTDMVVEDFEADKEKDAHTTLAASAVAYLALLRENNIYSPATYALPARLAAQHHQEGRREGVGGDVEDNGRDGSGGGSGGGDSRF